MITIVPAIIPQSFSHLSSVFKEVGSFTHTVQIDIVDGVFVPFTSWPYTEHASPALLTNFTKDFDIEIDLMADAPEGVAEEYLVAGVKRIVIHLESTQKLETIIALKKKYQFKLGLSILNDTDLSVLTSVITHADYVQLMGIQEIGSQAQPFDTRVIERITILKGMYPNLQISVDGSVNEKTLPLLIEAGATRFAVGSAILGAENPASAYAILCTL